MMNNNDYRKKFFETQARLRDLAESYNLAAFYYEEMFILINNTSLDIIDTLNILDEANNEK